MSSKTNSLDAGATKGSPRIWRSTYHVDVPSADIVSFAFANLANYDADKPVFINAYNASEFVSTKNARNIVSQLMNGFRAIGLVTGDCVCLHSYNNIWYPLLWLGIIGAGGCFTGSNPAYTSSELIHHFKNTNPKYIIAQEECLDAIEEAAEKCQIPKSQIFVITKHSQSLSRSYPPWETLLNFGKADWTLAENEEKGHSNVQTPAVYAATSGTTGLPKAATISHRYIVAQAVMIEEFFRNRAYEPKQLVTLPVFHAFAAQIALLLPLRLGLPTYLMPRFKLDDFIQMVKAFGITDVAVVPPMVTALSALGTIDASLLTSLRYIICAGAPISADVQCKLYNVIPQHSVVSQCWGATEVGWITLFGQEEKDTSGSVGRLMPNVELKILGDSGEVVSCDNIYGEAYVRSPAMFSGYLSNIEASTSSIDATGFYRTGDRVCVRENKVFIDGRIKDIMKVNGWQVSPAEIEDILLQHDKIADVAVVGVRGTTLDGLEEIRPRAYVVPRRNITIKPYRWRYLTPPESPILNTPDVLTEKEVRDYVASNLISYKRLSGGVRFVTKIPRNATGKILRQELTNY